MLPYNIFDFENHLFFLSIYVLCFIYLFQVNTEYPSMILLALLNFVYILVHFISVSETNVKILGFEVPLRVIILIIWSLLMMANIWLVKTYINLRATFSKKGEKINLGKKENFEDKKNLKFMLVYGTISLLMLHILSDYNGVLMSIISKRANCLAERNTMKIVFSAIGLVTSFASALLSDRFSSNTNIITTH